MKPQEVHTGTFRRVVIVLGVLVAAPLAGCGDDSATAPKGPVVLGSGEVQVRYSAAPVTDEMGFHIVLPDPGSGGGDLVIVDQIVQAGDTGKRFLTMDSNNLSWGYATQRLTNGDDDPVFVQYLSTSVTSSYTTDESHFLNIPSALPDFKGYTLSAIYLYVEKATFEHTPPGGTAFDVRVRVEVEGNAK